MAQKKNRWIGWLMMTVMAALMTVLVPGTAFATGEGGSSSDATLVTLTVAPGAMEPEFSPEVTEYTVYVENKDTRLAVSARTAAEEAKFVVSNTDLQVGDNEITIRVTAGDGTLNTYTLYVVRPAEGESIASTEQAGGNETAGVPEQTFGEQTLGTEQSVSQEGEDGQKDGISARILEILHNKYVRLTLLALVVIIVLILIVIAVRSVRASKDPWENGGGEPDEDGSEEETETLSVEMEEDEEESDFDIIELDDLEEEAGNVWDIGETDEAGETRQENPSAHEDFDGVKDRRTKAEIDEITALLSRLVCDNGQSSAADAKGSAGTDSAGEDTEDKAAEEEKAGALDDIELVDLELIDLEEEEQETPRPEDGAAGKEESDGQDGDIELFDL